MHIESRDIVFVFDLHDVLVSKNYTKMIVPFLKKAYRIDLLFFLCNPFFIFRLFKLLKTSRVPEHYIIELSDRYPRLLPFIEIIINAMNEQKLINQTLQTVISLQKKGYPRYLFSNIGERTFALLIKKYPLLLQLFDGYLVVEEYDNWIQKPQPEAFQKFLKTFDLQSMQCVFIDNSKKNINIAQQEGFNTILYRSPEQLIEELKLFNVALK